MSLKEKIETKKVKIGVIGLGYVGLPLSVHFALKGFEVLGFDIKRSRVNLVNQGKSYIKDAKESELAQVVSSKKLSATWDHNRLKECDVVQICVPTPVNPNKEPNVSYIVSTTNKISKSLRRGQLIILKSTTFPETTQRGILPILERSGLKVGKDFFLAFSPERIDPGNKKFKIGNTPTVVGGVTSKCTELAGLLYKSVGAEVIPVSSPTIAEMTKLLENVFRNVNIALVNELAQLCERMHINIWEVIDAAKTKPFGFMPFYPGPGVGGHCIPIDPYFLSWKAREYDFHTSFIELSAKVNENMPYYIANKVIESLSSKIGMCPREAKVLVLGIAFKKDVEDLRDSPALKVIEILEGKVAKVFYNDPYIKNVTVNGHKYTSFPLNNNLGDCVLITTDHSVYNYEWIVNHSKLVVDTRNATKGLKRGNIVQLGC